MYVPTDYLADEQARENESGFLKAAATAIVGTKGIRRCVRQVFGNIRGIGATELGRDDRAHQR